MLQILRAGAFCTLLVLSNWQPARAAEADVLVGSVAPSGQIIAVQDFARLSADNASLLQITSNLPATDLRVTLFRKFDRSDAVTSECVTPCRLLVPKRYGLAIVVDVPTGQRLSSAPVAFIWSQPWWCRGGLLCRTELSPSQLALQIDEGP